jgi:cytidylate kinase
MAGQRSNSPQKISIVGPCGAGKSTLVEALQVFGIRARQIAQEHSYVGNMWQHFGQPDALIYLDVSYEEASQRKHLDWLPKEYQRQVKRLTHAREHCDLYLHTDHLTPEQVVENVLKALGVGRDP